MLVAGAGYGKTTLLEGALRERGGPVAWAAMTEAEREPGRLLVTLLQALDAAVPGVGGPVLERLGASAEPLAIAGQLPSELGAVMVETVVLVIDDAERLVGATEALAVLETLLRARPGRLRIAVATRRPLGLALAKTRLAGHMSELGEEDLVFSPDECAEVLRSGSGHEPTAGEIAERMEATRGWPLGVVLGAQSAEHPEMALDAFLAEEVLAPLSDSLSAALLRSASVDALTPPLLEALALPSDFPAVVATLGLTLAPVADRPAAVSYHPLVRELLRARWRRECPDGERAVIMARVAGPLAREGATLEAIEAWLDARCWDDALALITASAPLLVGSSPATVEAWLERLPGTARRSPLARLLAAQLLLNEGRQAQAAEEMRDVLPDLRDTDLTTQWSARLVLAECLYFSGDFDDVPELAAGFDDPQVRALGGMGDAVVLWAAMAHAAAGRIRNAERLARNLELTGGEDVGVLRTWREAYVRGPSGDVDDVLVRVAQELDIADRDPHLWRPELLLPTSIWLLTGRGRFGEALELNDQHMQRLGQHDGRADLAALAYVLHAWLLAHCDRPGEARAALAAARPGLPRTWPSAVAEGTLALLAHGAGETANAAAIARRANESLRHAPTLLADLVALSLIPLIAAVDPAGARAMINQSIGRLALTHPGRWGRLHRSRLLAQRAWIGFRQAEGEGWIQDLVASLTEADDMAAHLLYAEWSRLREPAVAGMEHAIGIPGVLEALESALPDEALRLTAHPSPVVRRRAAEALARSGHGETTPRLTALTEDPDPEVAATATAALTRVRRVAPARTFTLLGAFGLRRGSWTVDDRAWERPMAQRLVRLLVALRDQVVLEDDLFEAFWPGKAPAAARSSLQVTVSRARAVLDPPESTTSSIRSAGGGYQLVLGPGDRVDADEFERSAAAALAAQGPARRASLEAAEQLWTGEPLPEDRYAEWARPWRERLERTHREVLGALIEARLADGALAGAAEAAHRALRADPLDEGAHRALIVAYARAGRRGRALRQYLECRRALVDELGIEPADETAQLQRRVLAGASF